jgi:hypothetical protein
MAAKSSFTIAAMPKRCFGRSLFAELPKLAAVMDVDTNTLARLFLSASKDKDGVVSYDDDRHINRGINMFLEKACDAGEGKEMIAIVNKPKAGRPIGDCYQNAAKEMIETGNPAIIGYLFAVVGNAIEMTPHGFNYNKRTKTYYDTDTPRHTDSLGVRCGFTMMSPKSSYLWFKNKHREELPFTRGVFYAAYTKDKFGGIIYAVKNLTEPTEVRTVKEEILVKVED